MARHRGVAGIGKEDEWDRSDIIYWAETGHGREFDQLDFLTRDGAANKTTARPEGVIKGAV